MFNNFRINILIRIVLITGIIGLLIYFALVDVRYLRSVYIVVFLVIAIGEFIWYVERTNRDFTNFLLALKQGDFTTTFNAKNKGRSFNKLYAAFNEITAKFEQISSAKEVQHLYLEALVDHLRVGIISFDNKEKIHLMNTALQKMLDRKQVAFLNNLENIDPELPEVLRTIKPKENRLFKIKIKNELLQLSIHASEFVMGNTYYKLISIQNIKNELDANELEAWQKLIRVLTHEIMNSVTPITSLSGTLRHIVENEPADSATMHKLSQGLEAIQLRSAGLQNFTDAYRKLTKIPKPNFTTIALAPMIERLLLLLEVPSKKIMIEVNVPDNLTLIADKDLLEQVLINIIKNALEALQDISAPKITIETWHKDQTHIIITDNGCGIDEDKIDNIFTPFFTTKKEGSGIGLALSRQIMRLHNGNIQVQSVKGEGTSFILVV